MEQERGISITASVLNFDYEGFPHQSARHGPATKTSRRTRNRALTAADSAIMLIDNRKGVESQTRKLFNVCQRRRLPIFTLVNKCDRVGEDPFGIIDDVHTELGIRAFAATWPVRKDGRLIGVYDRADDRVILYTTAEDHGQSRPEFVVTGLDNDLLEQRLGPNGVAEFREELELLDVAGEQPDADAVAAAEATPVFFGSALTNFGVDVLLERFLATAPSPVPRESTQGVVDPVDTPFSGFVFKVQANMDLKHRDRVAFLRVCSGRFEAGVDAVVSRTGKTLRLTEPQEFMARERSLAEDVVAGDVVGLHDRGSLRVGDTVAVAGGFEYPGIPRFSPEHFAQVRLDQVMRRKQLDRGLSHLARGRHDPASLRAFTERPGTHRRGGRPPPVRRTRRSS